MWARALVLWKSCLYEDQIEREMTTICVSYLHLSDLDHSRLKRWRQQTEYDMIISKSMQLQASESFRQYCAEYWTLHLEDDFLRENERLLSHALSLFTTNSDLFAKWFPFTWNTVYPYKGLPQFSDQHVIAITGHTFAFQKMLEGGDEPAVVDAKDSTGRTALQWAAERGHKQMVQLLLERGANIDAEGRYGTALVAGTILYQ